MDWYSRTIGRVSEHVGQIAAFLILPLIATIVYSVMVRYMLNEIVPWAFEISIFLYGIMVTIGGAYTLKHKAHVRVDVLPDYLGPRWRCILDIASFLMVIAVCLLITWIGTRAAWMSTLRLERSSLQTPFDPQIWWFRWFIPVSATLIALQAVAEIVGALRTLEAERAGDDR
jgi:TRAP-type mannitol/chloroaromatic compound transport system permease small subunit